jgi:hypothetical protein
LIHLANPKLLFVFKTAMKSLAGASELLVAVEIRAHRLHVLDQGVRLSTGATHTCVADLLGLILDDLRLGGKRGHCKL